MAAFREDSWSSEVSSKEDFAPGSASTWFDALESDSGDGDSTFGSNSDDEAGDHLDTPITEVMKHTEDILDQLIRLGLAIRKSGTTARLRKADNSFKQENHRDLQRHLALSLLAEAGKQQDNERKNTKERIVDPDKSYDQQLTPEQKHLIVANLRRRHRFLYARRHQRKLEEPLDLKIVQETERATQTVEIPKTVALSQGHQSSIQTSKANQDVKDTPRDPGISGMTATAASAVEGDILKAATPSQAASRVSVTTVKLNYPSPPPESGGMRSFKCPCCYQTLPVMFRERSRWRYVLLYSLDL